MPDKEYASYGVLNKEFQDEMTDASEEEAKAVKKPEECEIIDVELVEGAPYHSVIEEEEELEFPIVKSIYTSKYEQDEKNDYTDAEEEVKQEQKEEKTSETFTEAEKFKEKKRDTSFNQYKSTSKHQERSFLAKWTVRLGKLVLFLMLLPFIAVVGGMILGATGLYVSCIVGAIIIGIFILGMTAFMGTQITTSLIALGIAAGVTALSGGLLLGFIGKGVIEFFIKLWRNRRSRRSEGEV